MITPAFDQPAGGNSPCVHEGQLATAARETIASFLVVSDMLTAVGSLAVTYGIGQPLAAFQALLQTYQTLLAASDALSATAGRILDMIRATAAPAAD